MGRKIFKTFCIFVCFLSHSFHTIQRGRLGRHIPSHRACGPSPAWAGRAGAARTDRLDGPAIESPVGRRVVGLEVTRTGHTPARLRPRGHEPWRVTVGPTSPHPTSGLQPPRSSLTRTPVFECPPTSGFASLKLLSLLLPPGRAGPGYLSWACGVRPEPRAPGGGKRRRSQ